MICLHQLINSLTSDEDLRQELWVHYLAGNPPDSLSGHLQVIAYRAHEPERLRESIQSLLTCPLSSSLDNIIKTFSSFEQSIICLLVLGYDIAEISSYIGITEVRIRQTISVIGLSPAWEAIKSTRNGPKKTIK